MAKKGPNSTTESDLSKTNQHVQHSSPYIRPIEDDTIDLYELCIVLWGKRWLVIGMTLVAALGSVVYALILPSIYKAESLLLPPKSKDVQSLNVQGVDKLGKDAQQRVDAENIFEVFKNNISSRTLQKKFINEFELLKILVPERSLETRDEEIYENFAGMFKIENEGGVISISIELYDPNVAAQWVNDYVQFIDFETISMIVEEVKNSIKSQIRDIEYQISSKRQMAKQRREDQILRYNEALAIASKLGVEDRVDTTNVVQNNQLSISTHNTPLYYRGTKALIEEMKVLKERKSDDPFIIGLRDLQENLALLRSININTERLHSVSIDLAAFPPKNRFKPDRRMIVTVGTAAGLFSGIFLAFFASFVMKLKEDYSEKS